MILITDNNIQVNTMEKTNIQIITTNIQMNIITIISIIISSQISTQLLIPTNSQISNTPINSMAIIIHKWVTH